jgi:hypothetical protein
MKMKMVSVVAYILFSLCSSTVYAASNAETIASCSSIYTILSAKSLNANWPANAKQALERARNRYDQFAIREFGSMEAFAQYNRTFSKNFYQWYKQQPDQGKIDNKYIDLCSAWSPK